MEKVLVVLLLLVGLTQEPQASPQTPNQDATPEFVGVYVCEGTNPDGSSYKGIAEIVKFHASFLVRWSLPDNVQVYGVGVESGGALAVGYFGGAPGVILYRFDGDKLIGKWTMGGTNGGLFTETLTRIPSDQLEQKPPGPEKTNPLTPGGVKL